MRNIHLITKQYLSQECKNGFMGGVWDQSTLPKEKKH